MNLQEVKYDSLQRFENTVNMDTLEILRKELENLVAEKVRSDISMQYIQGTIQELEKLIQNKNLRKTEALSLNEQLKNEVYTEINKEIEIFKCVEELKKYVETCKVQQNLLKNSIDTSVSNTENMKATTNLIKKQFDEYVNLQTKKFHAYEKEINELEFNIKAETLNNNNIIQTKELELQQIKQKSESLAKEKERLRMIYENENTYFSNLNSEFEKKSQDIENKEKDIFEMETKISEFENIYKSLKANNKEKINIHKEKMIQDEKRIQDIQIELDIVKQEHNKLDSSTAEILSDLETLKTDNINKNKQFETEELELNNLKIEISENLDKPKKEVEMIKNEIKIMEESVDTLKAQEDEIEKNIESKKAEVQSLKQILLDKSQQEEDFIAKNEKKQQDLNEQTLENKKIIDEYMEKINEAKNFNENIKKEQENLKEMIESKEKIIGEIQKEFQQRNEQHKKYIQKKIIEIESNQKELQNLKEERESKSLKFEELISKFEETKKQIENNFHHDCNKIKSDFNEFNDKISEEMDKFDKQVSNEKDLLSTKKSMLMDQLNNMKDIKLKLQQQLKEKVKDVMHIANKIETGKTELKKMEVKEIEAENIRKEKFEAEKIKAEKIEAEKIKAEKIEAEKIKAEKIEAERVRAEKTEAKRIESEKILTSYTEAKKIESKRIDNEKFETKKDSIKSPKPQKFKPGTGTSTPKKILKIPEPIKSQIQDPKKVQFSRKNTDIWPTDNDTTDDSIQWTRSGPKMVNKIPESTTQKPIEVLHSSEELFLTQKPSQKKLTPPEKSQTKITEIYKRKISFFSSDDSFEAPSKTQKSTDQDENFDFFKNKTQKNTSQDAIFESLKNETQRSTGQDAIFDSLRNQTTQSINQDKTFDSLKNETSQKSIYQDAIFDSLKSGNATRNQFLIKPAPNYKENDSSDDSFYGKVKKSFSIQKKITKRKNSSDSILTLNSSPE